MSLFPLRIRVPFPLLLLCVASMTLYGCRGERPQGERAGGVEEPAAREAAPIESAPGAKAGEAEAGGFVVEDVGF
jgi:hypothetical protein